MLGAVLFGETLDLGLGLGMAAVRTMLLLLLLLPCCGSCCCSYSQQAVLTMVLGLTLLRQVAMLSIWLGGRMMERLADSKLKLSVGYVLIGIGLFSTYRTVVQLLEADSTALVAFQYINATKTTR